MTQVTRSILAIFLAVFIGLGSPSGALAGGPQRAVAKAAVARMEQSIGAGFRRAGGRVRPAPPVRLKPGLAARPCRAIAVKCAGLRREAAAQRILSQRYPSERIQSETYLLNRTGRPAIDPKTRTARRIDYVMFSGGNVSRRFEVTSQHADKAAQLAKERRILTLRLNGMPRRGPLYVRDRQSGGLAPVRPIPSEVIRFH